MNSKDDLFNFYLSASDDPTAASNKQNHMISNHRDISKLVDSEDLLEEAVSDGVNSITSKRLLLNPFLDENIRIAMFKDFILSLKLDETISDICIDSYFNHNSLSIYKRISSKTYSFVDWKFVKIESIKQIYHEFIGKHGKDSNDMDLKILYNKIFNQ